MTPLATATPTTCIHPDCTAETPISVCADHVNPVPPTLWGKDHWSTFAYVEVRCVDHGGHPRHANLRTDAALHPEKARPTPAMDGGGRYPTRLCAHPETGDSVELPHHDDWSCVEDMEAAGLLHDVGSGMQPRWKMTDLGNKVAGLLRTHKTQGGSWGTFTLPDILTGETDDG